MPWPPIQGFSPALAWALDRASQGLEQWWHNTAGIEAVLLEEVGHAFDPFLDGHHDTSGDEGARFSAASPRLLPPHPKTTSAGSPSTAAPC